MNLIATVVTFILMGWIAGVSLVFMHLFRERWASPVWGFVGLAFGFFSVPVSVGVGLWIGGSIA